MKNPRAISREERLQKAEALLAQAEALQARYMKTDEVSLRSQRLLTLKAYQAYSRAIALFETLGDMADREFKRRLAGMYEQCSYCMARHAYITGKNGESEMGAQAIHARLYKKAADLHAQILGPFNTDEGLMTVWEQILRLNNVVCGLRGIGAYGEAEQVLLDCIDLQRRFADANDGGRLDPRIWPRIHLVLAETRLALDYDTTHVIETINAGLGPFQLDKLSSAFALADCAALCSLKSSLIDKLPQS